MYNSGFEKEFEKAIEKLDTIEFSTHIFKLIMI